MATAQDLLDGEMSQTKIAAEHGVTPSAVSKWNATLENEGIKGLKNTNKEGNQGPDSQLKDHDRDQLIELLEDGAQAHGWETDLWTRKRVAALIERAFDIDYSQRHCSRILRELGYRPVKPEQEAAEKDPEAKRQWLKEEGEQLKKLTDGDTILCIDESLYRYEPVTTEGRAKEGSYPEVTAVEGDWRTVSAISALALWHDNDPLQTKVFLRLHLDKTITSHLIRDFLHQIRLQLAGQITVLWDRGSVHTAKWIGRFFETYDRFDEIRIPTCCPELNPCEGVWDWSKYNDMNNVAPLTFDGLISRIRSSLIKMKY